MPKNLPACLALMLVLCICTGTSLRAQDSQSVKLKATWNSLPDSTVAAMRIPQMGKNLATFRKLTQFGSKLLTADLLKQLTSITEENGLDLDELREGLAKFGLKFEDLSGSLTGDVGAALTVSKLDSKTPISHALIWFDAPGELGDRYLGALSVALDEAKEDSEEIPPRRVDFELNGHNIIHLAIPDSGKDLSDLKFPDSDSVDETNWEEWFKKRQEAQKNRPVIQLDQSNILISRLEERVLILISNSNGADAAAELRKETADVEIDFDELSHLEHSKDLLAKIIEAHQTEETSSFIVRTMSTAGLQSAMPKGTPIFDLLFDSKAMFTLIKKELTTEQAKGFDQVGLDSVNAAAMRIALDGTQIRSSLFVQAPSPRQGILGLLDQPSHDPTAPQWVPKSAIGSAHFSLDLNFTYNRVKELISTIAPSAKLDISRGEFMVQGFLEVEVSELLSSLGSRISTISFEPRWPSSKQKRDLSIQEGSIPERLAIVIPVENMELWTKIMQKLRPFASQVVEVEMIDDEQGFTGLRNSTLLEMSMLLGHGYLIITSGEGVEGEITSAIRKAPKIEDSFAGGTASAMGQMLLPSRNCLISQLYDYNRYALSISKLFGPILEKDMASAALKAIQALFPTNEELKDMFGVGKTQLYVTEHGLILDNVQQLGAAR